jgi:hypothetical protein
MGPKKGPKDAKTKHPITTRENTNTHTRNKTTTNSLNSRRWHKNKLPMLKIIKETQTFIHYNRGANLGALIDKSIGCVVKDA